MAGFDDLGVYYSDNFSFGDQAESDSQRTDLQAAKRRFKDFIREFHEGNYVFNYRYLFSVIADELYTFVNVITNI